MGSGPCVLSCRDDLVQVGVGPGNHTLTVRTINVGLTLVAVRDGRNVGVADYVPIPVEGAIHPREAHRLVVGDVVCFSAQLSSADGETCPSVGGAGTVWSHDISAGAFLAPGAEGEARKADETFALACLSLSAFTQTCCSLFSLTEVVKQHLSVRG